MNTCGGENHEVEPMSLKKLTIELDEKTIRNLDKLSFLYRERKHKAIDIKSDKVYKEIALMAALCVLDLYEEEIEKQGLIPGLPCKITTS